MVERAAAFADDPRAVNLVGIKPGRMTGNWRDSEQGLGRGRYAYDVNAALVPAALDAAARLLESGLLDEYLDADQRRTLTQARARARVWAAQRAALLRRRRFRDARARQNIAAYAKEIGVDGERALTQPERRAAGVPRTVAGREGHADPDPAFGRGLPAAADGARRRMSSTRCVDAIMRPFPAGLMTDVGLLVANPALASAELRREFTRFAYHGTVVWSWQQALLAAGLERQLRRADLPAARAHTAVAARARTCGR